MLNGVVAFQSQASDQTGYQASYNYAAFGAHKLSSIFGLHATFSEPSHRWSSPLSFIFPMYFSEFARIGNDSLFVRPTAYPGNIRHSRSSTSRPLEKSAD